MNIEDYLAMLLTSPESVELIQETVEKYKPLVYAILEEGFKLYKDYTANDEYFAERAKAKWQMLNAYVSAGFTREEAMRFILGSDTQLNDMLKSISSNVKVNNKG
jgi:hypothetical protein